VIESHLVFIHCAKCRLVDEEEGEAEEENNDQRATGQATEGVVAGPLVTDQISCITCPQCRLLRRSFSVYNQNASFSERKIIATFFCRRIAHAHGISRQRLHGCGNVRSTVENSARNASDQRFYNVVGCIIVNVGWCVWTRTSLDSNETHAGCD
jgi:hypothetical protein